VNRILVWGLFGIGFDILFGYTGLLSFGQSALYGTGGLNMVMAERHGNENQWVIGIAASYLF